MDIVIENEAFSSKQPDRGFTVKAHYLSEPKCDALVEIYKDDQPYRRFLYPAYKIWNIAAHFSDIIDGELEGSMSGYDLAGWAGFHIVPDDRAGHCEDDTPAGERIPGTFGAGGAA